MQDEPENEELNIERPFITITNWNTNMNSYVFELTIDHSNATNLEKLMMAHTLPTLRCFVKILKWMILERKHLLKTKAIFSEQFLNSMLDSMLEYAIQKKRLFVDKASLAKPEPEEEPET